MENIVLENNRVYLRTLNSDDFEALLPFAMNEPELWTYSLVSGAGKQNFRNYINQALTAKGHDEAIPFIITDKESGKVAGCTRFYDISKTHKAATLGYTWYGKEFQGTGLNNHCKFLLLQYAFETLKLERVEFRADNENKRSIAAMKKIGCVEEGVLRSNCASLTGRRDSIVLSILKEEWTKSVKKKIKSLL